MSHAEQPAGTESQIATLRSEVAWWRGLSIAMLVVGVAVAFLLVREVRSHNTDNARMDVLQKQIDAMGKVLKDTRVEDLTLVNAQGEAASTDFSSAPLTLVILLSNHCSACESSAPAWAMVSSQAQAEGVPTRMIVTDAGAKPEPSQRWAGLVPHIARDAERTWLRDIPGVPSGVLVDSGGVVRQTWVRPLSPADVEGVVASVKLELQRVP